MKTTPDRRRVRKCFLGTLCAAALPLAHPWAGRADAAETYTMRLSHADDATSTVGVSTLRFSAAVERRSNGQLKIEVYPNGQLAKERESVDGLTTGAIDFVTNGATWLESLFPRYQVLELPFLFKDLATAERVLDGPIGNDFFVELESKGIIGLGWGYNGFQQMETVSKAIVVPEDMKGQRIRVQNSAVYVAMAQALGAIPVPLDVSEIFTGLAQHTVDGTAVGLDNFTTHKWYTIAKHVAMTNHLLSINPLLGSKRKVEALPPNLQKIVKEEGKAVISFWRSLAAPRLAESIKFLKQNGVAFTDVQYPAFRKAMDPVYVTVQSKLGSDLIERVTRAANAT